MLKKVKLPGLIYEMTTLCNLKCKYCIFSETYSNTRNKTANVMSKDTAFSALDYFFDKMKANINLFKINTFSDYI